jgi:hypothetical protein
VAEVMPHLVAGDEDEQVVGGVEEFLVPNLLRA